MNQVTQLVRRYGVLTRELVTSEGIRGGFAGIYPVLKAMEESGKLRRGYFVAGLGAAQFAAPGADDRLRHPSRPRDDPSVWVLASTDPANPYGAAVPWPKHGDPSLPRPQRVAGARVVLHDGQLIGYLGRAGQHLLTYLPPDEPQRSESARALAAGLVAEAARQPIQLHKIDGASFTVAPLAPVLRDAGFLSLSQGLLHRGPATNESATRQGS